MSHRLWRSDDGRSFLVPEDLTLTPGYLVLRDRYETIRVDPEHVSYFIVSDADAHEWRLQRYARIARDSEAAWDRFLGTATVQTGGTESLARFSQEMMASLHRPR